MAAVKTMCKKRPRRASFWWMRTTLLTAAVALCACAPKSTVGVKVDAALDTLVPADTVMLVGTRLEALRKTPAYQNHLADRSIPQIDEFANRIGIDPRKDLWELLYASNGRDGVLLGRGKFADQEMEPKLEKEGARSFNYKGFNLVGNAKGAVWLINSSTAAVGEIPALESLIDQRGTSHGPPPALGAMMKDIPAEAQFWAVYAGGPVHLPFEANSNLGNLNKLVSLVQSGTLYFDLRDGLHGVVQGNCANEDGAQQVQGALKALVGLGRLSVPKDQPELAQVYDGIRVTEESGRVRLYLDVPQAMVDKFLGLWLKP